MAENSTLSDDFISGDLLPDDVDDNFFTNDDELPGVDITPGPGDDYDNDEDDIDYDGDDKDEDDEDGDLDDADDAAGVTEPEDPEKNEFYLRAQYWQERGELAKDIVLNKDMTQLDLENLKLEQDKENILNRIKTDVSDILKAKGINPNEIFGGQTNDQFFQKEYANIASLTYDTLIENSDDVSDTLRRIGTEYWISKSGEKLTDEEVAALVDKDLDSNTEEDLFETKYQPYFAQEAKRLATKVRYDAEAADKAAKAKSANDAAYIKQKLEKGEIGGKKYSAAEIQKIQDAFSKKNQTYDNGRGERRTGISLFEKKRLEAADNLDLQLEMAVGLVLGAKDQDSKGRSERVGAVNILEKLANATLGNTKSESRNKKTTTKSRELEEMLLAEN